MTKYQHLIVSIIFFSLMLFEVIIFTDILTHPYMVGLLLFLGSIGGFNLGAFFIKNKNCV